MLIRVILGNMGAGHRLKHSVGVLVFLRWADDLYIVLICFQEKG